MGKVNQHFEHSFLIDGKLGEGSVSQPFPGIPLDDRIMFEEGLAKPSPLMRMLCSRRGTYLLLKIGVNNSYF
jgi:hypothetical protein